MDDAMESPTLDRFRTAMKFSLWAWAFYWPGGGILLLVNGLDLVSIAVTLLSLGSFIFLLAFGGLRPTSSHTMKEFLLERPLYLVAVLLLLLLLVQFFPAAGETSGLVLFATIHLGALGLAGRRLWIHLRETDQTMWASKADQVFIVLGLVGLCSFMVFLDAWIPALGGDPIPATATSVAIANWVNLLYPPLLMVASRPFREPLRKPERRREPTPEGTPEADGPIDA